MGVLSMNNHHYVVYFEGQNNLTSVLFLLII